MKPSDRDILLVELKTIFVGIEGTDERGLAGDIKDIKNHLALQNGRVRKNTIAIISLISFLSGAGILQGLDIIHIFGG